MEEASIPSRVVNVEAEQSDISVSKDVENTVSEVVSPVSKELTLSSAPCHESLNESAPVLELPEPSPAGEQLEIASSNVKRKMPSSDREALQEDVHNLIGEINVKRTTGTQIVADYKLALNLQVEKNCNVLEQHMGQLYEQQGKAIAEKLQDLFATFDRIAKIEEELLEFRNSLKSLYQDVQPVE